MELKDKNSLLILASLAVILLGLISFFFSISNPKRQEYIYKQNNIFNTK